MLKLVLCVLLIVSSGLCNILHQSIIDVVNSDSSLHWKAGKNSYWEGKTDADVLKLLNADLKGFKYLEKSSLSDNRLIDIPETFDSREQWPRFIHPIQNQGSCGDCWGIAAIEAFSDRYAIAQQYEFPLLSIQWLVDCDTLDNGCQGGSAENVWRYFEYFGVPEDKCDPYVSGECPSLERTCPAVCANGSEPKLYFTKNAYSLGPDEPSIQRDILMHGPVEACFNVYSDFMHYKSGVYHHSSTAVPTGGHCVKMIGWGTEDGLPYWLISNSWGAEWGDHGNFKILRGTDESGIESEVAAGIPNMSAKPGPPSPGAIPPLEKKYQFGSQAHYLIQVPGQTIDVKSLMNVYYYNSAREGLELGRVDSFGTATESMAQVIDFKKLVTYTADSFYSREDCEVDPGLPSLYFQFDMPTDAWFKNWTMAAGEIAQHWIYQYIDEQGAKHDTHWYVAPIVAEKGSFALVAQSDSYKVTHPMPATIAMSSEIQWYKSGSVVEQFIIPNCTAPLTK